MIRWREDDAALTMAFTDRRGGVSRAPWDSFNLGGHVEDDPAAVAENRARLAEAVGVAGDRLVGLDQVHGAEVAHVREKPAVAPTADALVTEVPDLALMVLVADCTPVLLADAEAGVVGAAHAGRDRRADGARCRGMGPGRADRRRSRRRSAARPSSRHSRDAGRATPSAGWWR